VRHETSGEVRSVAAAATSLSAAFIRRLGAGLSVSVNAARSERAPAAEELFSNGPHLASNTFEVGTPTLGVETSRHLDLSLRRTAGRVTFALTAFRTLYDDFIYLAATGAEDGASGMPIYAYVQHDAELVGVEAELFAQVAELGAGELDLRLYADTVRAKLGYGERLPRIPPRRAGLRAQYHDERLVAGIEAVRYAAQTRTAAFETPTEGYSLIGFDIAWTLRNRSDRPIDLFIKGTNLLDEEARKHTSIVKDLAPLPGRNLAIGVRASL
jgi:iron complex outermembrane recepter protein